MIYTNAEFNFFDNLIDLEAKRAEHERIRRRIARLEAKLKELKRESRVAKRASARSEIVWSFKRA